MGYKSWRKPSQRRRNHPQHFDPSLATYDAIDIHL
jgi:hypothetical protein